MSEGAKPVGDERREAPAAPSGPAEGAPGPRVGLATQPLALRILLLASVTALTVGVVRCAIELSGVAPPISRIGVERALVEIDEDTAWAPADSVSARVARVFADALRRAADVDVRVARPGAAGFDAIARLRIDGTRGGVRTAVGVVDASSGRPLFETSAEGTPEMIPGLLNRAAERAAAKLGLGDEGGSAAERGDAGSG